MLTWIDIIIFLSYFYTDFFLISSFNIKFIEIEFLYFFNLCYMRMIWPHNLDYEFAMLIWIYSRFYFLLFFNVFYFNL
jgi:hypothetical protein